MRLTDTALKPFQSEVAAAKTQLAVAASLGTGVTGTTARLEAGLPSRALDFVGGYSLVEAGWRGPLRDAPFVGRAALARWLAEPSEIGRAHV